MNEVRRSHPAEGFLEDRFAVATAIVVTQGDGGIEGAALEGVERFVGGENADLQHQAGLGGVHALQE